MVSRCGDHAILNAVQRALPEIADQTDTPHNLFTFISGIGCSSRFIYYMRPSASTPYTDAPMPSLRV